MKKIFHIIITALFAAAIPACDPAPGLLTPSFSVSTSTVSEGEDVPVSVTVRNASESPYYTIVSEISEYDAASGAKTPTGARLLMRNGDPCRDGDQLGFSENGHRDFRIAGLPSGTYSVTITLTAADGSSATDGSVAVVTKKSTHGGSGESPDRILVSDFTVPAPGVNGTFDDNGNLLVPKEVYSSASPFIHDCLITPANAENGTLKAKSENPLVAGARIDAPSRLSIIPVAPGSTTIVVSTLDGTIVKRIPVVIPDTAGAGGVSNFSLPELPFNEHRHQMPYDGDGLSWIPTVEPDGLPGNFIVVSSDPAVATGTYDPSTGRISVIPHMPGYADLRIIADGGLGMSKNLPVTVYGNFTITVACVESSATDTQIRTHTFPCLLTVSCPTNIEFPSPVKFTFTMTATVAVKNKDLQQVTDIENVDFYGNRTRGYDMTARVLIPAWEKAGKPSESIERIKGTVVHDTMLDPALWRIAVNETWRNSGSNLSDLLLNN